MGAAIINRGAAIVQAGTYAAMIAELDAHKAEGHLEVIGELHTGGLVGPTSLILRRQWNAAASDYLPAGEDRLDRVTASQYGVQDGASATTGTTRTLTAGHNMPASGTLTIYDTSGATQVATGVSFTRASDVLTFASDPGTTATDDQFFVDNCEFGVIGGDHFKPDANTLAYFASGLVTLNGSCLIDDIGLLVGGTNESLLALSAKCTTATTAPGNDATQMVGWTTSASTAHCGGARYVTSAWERAVSWSTWTSPSMYTFPASATGGGAFTDIMVGVDVAANGTSTASVKTNPIYTHTSATDAVPSALSLGASNSDTSGGGLVVLAQDGGGTSCQVTVKSFTFAQVGV